jgi:phage repressor protein C with HTH and peptisase S24 domain/DNA-binding Xre family transcriptional regulator
MQFDNESKNAQVSAMSDRNPERRVKARQDLAREYIQNVLDRRGWNASELSRRIDVSSTTITRPLNHDDVAHAIRLENLIKIRDVSGIELPPALAAAYGLSPVPKTMGQPEQSREPEEFPNVRPAPYLGRDSHRKLADDIPVYGTVQGGAEGAFEMNMGEPIDWVRRPLALEGKAGLYSLYVEGDSMSPRFYSGERILVNSKKPASVGSDVILQLRPKREGDPIRAYLKSLVRRNSEEVVVRQFNPPKEMKFKVSEIHALHVVLNRDETF